MLDAPFRTAHRLQDRAQPRLLAIAAHQAHGAGEMLTAHQGVLEAAMEFIIAHVIGHQVFDRTTENVARRVHQFLQEVGVGPLHPAFGVQRQAQHFAFQALLDLLQAGQFFAKSRQLLLQTGVEHGAPMVIWGE